MRELLNRIFGRSEPETAVIELRSLPQFFSGREAALRSVLDAETAEPMQNIRNADAQLRLIVNTIAGAEHDPELHPKLKSIAKNTLPQFVRSMKAALAKELPDDPEEFYTAAIECVKACLNSLKGPGRYLQIVFPEEMKSARKGIDAIGTEINVMTAALGTYRRGMESVRAAQETWATLEGKNQELLKATEKAARIDQRLAEFAGRLAAIEEEEAGILKNPAMAEAEQKKVVAQVKAKARDETARIYASLSITASHVLRKAEKIAIRQKHPAEIPVLLHAMEVLSDHELPEPAGLKSALQAACPIAERMIGSGDIVLKNKEERAVFSDTGAFCTHICETCQKVREEEVAAREAEEAALNSPCLVRLGSLEREKGQLQAMSAKEQQAKQDLGEWQEKTRNEIPVLTEALRKKVGEIMGKNVQFPDGDRLPA